MGGECGTERPKVGIAGQTTHFTIDYSRLSHQFAVGMRSPYHIWIPDTGTADTTRAAYPASHIHSTSLFLTYRYLHPPTELRPRTMRSETADFDWQNASLGSFPLDFGGVGRVGADVGREG